MHIYIYNYVLLNEIKRGIIILINSTKRGVNMIITIALQKGGVAKSTTAQTLASCFGSIGKKVLLIDLDAQQNTTFSSGVEPKENTASDLLGGQCSPYEAILPLKYYDIIPADAYLTNVENADVPGNLLKDEIAPCADLYDIIIIDTPPALGNILKNALIASDYVIIPIEASPYSMQGIDSLVETIQSVRNSENNELKILGILLVKYHDRSIINRNLKSNIIQYASEIGTEVFETFIRESVVVKESQTCRIDLIDYAPKSNPAIDYKKLTQEILRRI